MKSFTQISWHGLFRVGLLLLVLTPLDGLVASPLDPPLSRIKQEAQRLVAMTKSGYYKALLVPDWRVKQVDTRQAVTAAGELCRLSTAKTSSAVKPLLLKGVRLDEKQVRLNWEASEQTMNAHFEIERSGHPTNDFETVGSLSSDCISSPAVSYQVIDPNPSLDYTYYRLKRIDFWGIYTYSPIIAIKGELPALSIVAFPNPGQQKNVIFQVAGVDATKPFWVILYDLQGRILYERRPAFVEADGRFAFPTIASLQPGPYYLRIIASDRQAVTPFILQP